MDFFNDIGHKVKKAVNKAAKKTEDIAELTKKKLSLKAEEDRLDSIYAQIGKLRYAELRAGEDKTDAIENLLFEADDCMDRIKALRASIAKQKKIKLCFSCGAELEENDLFCSVCGQNQSK